MTRTLDIPVPEWATSGNPPGAPCPESPASVARYLWSEASYLRDDIRALTDDHASELAAMEEEHDADVSDSHSEGVEEGRRDALAEATDELRAEASLTGGPDWLAIVLDYVADWMDGQESLDRIGRRELLRRLEKSATIRQNTNPTSPGKDVDTMSDAPDTAPDSAPMPKLDTLPTSDLLRLRGKVDQVLADRRDALQAQLDSLTAALADSAPDAVSDSKPSRSVTKGKAPARPKKRANGRTGGPQKVWTDERIARFVKVYTEDGSKAAAKEFGMKRQSAAQKMSALRKEGKAPKVGA